MDRTVDRVDRIWTGLCLTCFPPVLHETGRASDRVHERLADNQVHDLGEGDVQLLCDWPEPAGHRRRWGGPQLGDTGDEAGSHRKVNLEGGGERFQLGTDLRGERGDRGRCNVNLEGGRRARRAWRAPVTHSVGRERGDSGVAGNRVLGCRGRDEAIPCSVAPLCGRVSESVAPVCFGITGRRCLVMSLVRHNRTFKPPFWRQPVWERKRHSCERTVASNPGGVTLSTECESETLLGSRDRPHSRRLALPGAVQGSPSSVG